MKNTNTIQVFEHERLTTNHSKFSKRHLNALLKLNEYHDHTYFDAIPDGVKFNQHVGIIQIDGLTIEIHPKADKNDNNSKWRNVLLQMLIACGKLKASTAGSANVNRQNLNLLEVYFELFLTEVSQLIRQGLVKQYRKETNNVKALKGKLEFAGNIRKNLIHKERFYTKHQIYDSDHLLHQVIQRALEILEQFSKGTYLFDRCKRVIIDFPEVKRIHVSKNLLDKIILNRKTAPYSYALEIARLIILNYSPDISSGNKKMLSLLFDMNQLWEEFILVKLKKALENTSYRAIGQSTRSFLGSHYLQPDIVIENKYDPNEIYIIDTKWKLPTNNAASIADLRQMYAYGRFWNATKVMLLYPGIRTNKTFRSFRTDDYIKTDEGHQEIEHRCKLGFVSVVDESGKNLDSNIGKKVIEEMEIFYECNG